MPLYKCVASDKNGKKVEILREAASEDSLIASFSAGSFFLIKYSQVNNQQNFFVKKRFSKKTVMEFTDIFSSLLDSGLSVQDSLFMISEISDDSRTKQLSRELYTEILHGGRLYDALSLFPTTFSPLYRGLARLSEKTGNPSVIFLQISEYLHKTDEIKNKSSNAMIYPIFVLIFAIVACTALVTILLPRLADILIQFNTMQTVAVVDKINRMYGFLILVMVLIIFFFVFSVVCRILYRKINIFTEFVDRIFISLPVIGKYLVSKQSLDFAFAMELLSSSGRNITESLQESALSVSNLFYRKSVFMVYTELEKGKRLSEAFCNIKLFPSYISTWIRVGEQSGNVMGVFGQIRKYFQQNTERTVKRLLIWLEPLLIFVSGVIILFLVINFVIPIFTMYGTVL